MPRVTIRSKAMGDPIPTRDPSGRSYAGLNLLHTGPIPPRRSHANRPEAVAMAADYYNAELSNLVERYGGLLEIPIDRMKRLSDSWGFDPPEEYVYGRLVGRDLSQAERSELRKQDPELFGIWRRTRQYENPDMHDKDVRIR